MTAEHRADPIQDDFAQEAAAAGATLTGAAVAGGTSSAALEEAFGLFNRVSLQLTQAYAELQQRMTVLGDDLAAANAELRRQLEEKAALWQALPAGVLVLAGDAVEESNAAAAIAGVYAGMNWREARAGLTATQVENEFTRAMAGELIRLRVSESELGGGRRIVLIHDITHAHRLQLDLERHRRLSAMGEMAAGLAHQLRTPLSTALLYTAQLAGPGLGAEDAARFARKALDRLRHLERLIAHMLQFARGEVTPDETVDAAEVLAEAAQTVAPQMAQRGIAFDCTPPARAASLRANRRALVGALVNLLENAMQVQPVSRVWLDARAEGGRLRLRVRDDGPGVPESVAAKLFQPFFTTRAEGTGLGLAIARSVAQASGGSLELETAVSGAAFTLTLPCAPADWPGADGASPATEPGDGPGR